MMTASTDVAFGEGSDARINGKSRNACPYRHGVGREGTLRRYWLEGWWDAHRNWGKLSPPCLYRKLPHVLAK